MTLLLWALLAAPPLLVLLNVAANLVVWPRGQPGGSFRGRVSVLIPARDEAENIERCIRAVFSGFLVPNETIVYDDASTDATAAVLERLQRSYPTLRVLHGEALPPGWVGKPHASHHLAEAATGDLLVFLDADTVLAPSGLARLADVVERYDVGLTSFGVRQITGSPAERLLIPLLHLTYLAWLPLPLVWRSSDPRFLIANGQLLAVRRSAYQAAGGWAAVRAEVVDDVAFARRVKRSGGRVVFADGSRIAASRMYQGGRELRDGFAKNLYEGIGGRPAALALVLMLYLWVFVAPYLALGYGLAAAMAWIAPAATGVAANVLLRMVLAVRFRQPPEGVLLHPLSVLGFAWIAVASYTWSRRNDIRWRGRSYGSRESRSHHPPPAAGSTAARP